VPGGGASRVKPVTVAPFWPLAVAEIVAVPFTVCAEPGELTLMMGP